MRDVQADLDDGPERSPCRRWNGSRCLLASSGNNIPSQSSRHTCTRLAVWCITDGETSCLLTVMHVRVYPYEYLVNLQIPLGLSHLLARRTVRHLSLVPSSCFRQKTQKRTIPH